MPDVWTLIAFSLGLIAGGLASAPLIQRRYRAGYRAALHVARQVVLLYPDPRSAQLSSAHIACDDLRTAIADSLKDSDGQPAKPVLSMADIRRKGA